MLQISSLSFRYDHVELFQHLSFTVKPGEILHLRGSNGVGKSTLLAILAGLLSPSAGQVTWGKEEAGFPSLQRGEFFAYLAAEANGLYLQLNALSNLRFWSSLSSEPLAEETIRTALLRWGLASPLLQERLAVGFLSTGMRRRLALARVSLSPAPCWLLDEPIYGLDTRGVELFREALQNHVEQGGMAVVVSHDLVSLAGLTVRQYVLQDKWR